MISISIDSYSGKSSISFAGLSILIVEENVKYPGSWLNWCKDSFTEYQGIIKIVC